MSEDQVLEAMNIKLRERLPFQAARFREFSLLDKAIDSVMGQWSFDLSDLTNDNVISIYNKYFELYRSREAEEIEMLEVNGIWKYQFDKVKYNHHQIIDKRISDFTSEDFEIIKKLIKEYKPTSFRSDDYSVDPRTIGFGNAHLDKAN